MQTYEPPSDAVKDVMRRDIERKLDNGPGDKISKRDKDEIVEIQLALELHMLKLEHKGQPAMTKEEQIAWCEMRIRPIEAKDREADRKLTPSQRAARDRAIERRHQEKLCAAKKKAMDQGVPAEDVARMSLVDVLRAENIAAGKGALVHLTDRELGEENRRLQLENKVRLIEKLSTEEKKMARVVLDSVLDKSDPYKGYTLKERKKAMRESAKGHEDARRLREAEDKEALAMHEAAIKQKEITDALSKKRSELQWEWGYDPTASAKDRAACIMRCRIRRDARVIRFMQIVKHHSLMLFNVIRDARLNGTPEVDDSGNVVNQDRRSWITGQRLFLDIKVPPECFLDHAFAWQMHVGSVVRSLDQLQKRWKAFERGDNNFPSIEDKQEHFSLMKMVEEHDQDTHFVFRLTVQCDPLHHTLKATPKTLINTCGRDEYMFPDVIAAHEGGTQKECPPLCANPACSGVCMQPVRLLHKCTLTKTCRETKYCFCTKECKDTHLIQWHPESEEARKRARKLEMEARAAEDTQRLDVRRRRMERDELNLALREPISGNQLRGYGFALGTTFFAQL